MARKAKTNGDKILVSCQTLDAMADNIAAIAEAGRQLKNSRLKEKTVLVLLSHHTKLSQKEVKTVLDALPELERQYLK